MKITDVIRQVLDIVDAAEDSAEPTAVVEPQAEPDALIRIRQIAGLIPTDDDTAEYSNTPQEQTAPVAAAFPAGDDVHKSKNPADIRTNAPSMFPGFQAGMK